MKPLAPRPSSPSGVRQAPAATAPQVLGQWPQGAGLDRAAPPQALLEGRALSDHLPLLSAPTAVGRVLTYNVLTQARAADGRVNNGFGATETTAQYEALLAKLGAQLGELTRPSDVTLALLQEAPRDPAQLALLEKGLGPGWTLVGAPTQGERFGTAVAVRDAAFELGRSPPPELDHQAGRVQVLTLKPRDGSAPVQLANVHLAWGDDAVADLRALAQAPRTIIAGDFNREPDHPLRRLDALAGVKVAFPRGPSSVAFADRDRLRRIDGFVFKGV
ncbi:MAG: endonuclease/exonuclease/phosphatase family protein [Myxococcaceae bacterium]|nr:endonuclease/exonuclease/phosphatase family protein [Myxococcaceae bacterium]